MVVIVVNDDQGRRCGAAEHHHPQVNRALSPSATRASNTCVVQLFSYFISCHAVRTPYTYEPRRPEVKRESVIAPTLSVTHEADGVDGPGGLQPRALPGEKALL